MNIKSGSIPLSQAPLQEKLKIVNIKGEKDLCAKIAEIGIYSGATIQIRMIGNICLVRTGKNFIKMSNQLIECISVISSRRTFR